MNQTEDAEVVNSPYSRKVGERLRTIRKQKSLSLQEVEAQSVEEFKASVLGAYERGERAISVPRLERLANFYVVPVEQLLPRAGDDMTTEDDEPSGQRLVIDLQKVAQSHLETGDLLARYLRMLQVQRQDFNGRVITVRGDDIRAIAVMLSCHPDAVGQRLDDLGLRYID